MNTTISPHQAYPHTHLISNGAYSIFCDSAGAGASFAKDSLFYTRWRRDPVQRLYGTLSYLRDLDSGRPWSATYLPTCQEPGTYEVHFHPRSIEFKRTDFQIRLRMEITVAPEDAAELRRVTLFNEGLTARRIE